MSEDCFQRLSIGLEAEMNIKKEKKTQELCIETEGKDKHPVYYIKSIFLLFVCILVLCVCVCA